MRVSSIASNDEDGAEAEVHCDLFSCYSPIGAHSTHYDDEIEAIYVALKQLAISCSSFCRAAILSDSTSALQSLSNGQYTDNTCILECKELVMSISVSFQWIPAQCGISGNEAVDFLAQKWAGVLQRTLKTLSFHSAKLLIKGRYNTRIKQKALCDSIGKSWAPLLEDKRLIPYFPRRAAVALFRLTTGHHDCLPTYLYRFGLCDSPFCPLCGQHQIFDATHLDSCSALAFLNCRVQRYWKARELISS
ncbi:uncharacterized protein [Parasteatoda tepidariorum]|uniref:uncharacterized protein n=1 Tax=Parasteatoda tepidariorum TaxID=114398 RepID=UPI001C724BC1|nr:uncharacterized protein LOC107440631 [Parasteatoda tepidariorum]